MSNNTETFGHDTLGQLLSRGGIFQPGESGVDSSAIDARLAGAIVIGGIYDNAEKRLVSESLHSVLDTACGPEGLPEERGFVAALEPYFANSDLRSVDSTILTILKRRGGYIVAREVKTAIPSGKRLRTSWDIDGTRTEGLPDRFAIARDLSELYRIRLGGGSGQGQQPDEKVGLYLWSIFPR